jgi:hypothetical protein
MQCGNSCPLCRTNIITCSTKTSSKVDSRIPEEESLFTEIRRKREEKYIKRINKARYGYYLESKRIAAEEEDRRKDEEELQEEIIRKTVEYEAKLRKHTEKAESIKLAGIVSILAFSVYIARACNLFNVNSH